MTPSHPDGYRWRIARGALVACLAGLSLLPIANWIPGGHEADWYGAVTSLWLLGSLIVGAFAVIVAFAGWRYAGLLEPLRTRLAAAPRPSAAVVGAALVLAALALYATTASAIFSRKPLLIDELIQLYQARIFEAGRLWLPSTGAPEFFGSMHLVDQGGRVYGQFPPGGPALLAVGDIFGAAWLVGPVCGAVAVAAFVVFLRATEPGRATRWGAAALFAFAPFTVFQSASHMNHGFTLAALLVATAALAKVVTSGPARPALALVSGLGYGIAATIRPVDAFAFALPAGVWYLARAVRNRGRIPDLLAAGVGVAVPLAVLFWYNLHTTGAPLVFGYDVLWGKAHSLGFHSAPWGPVHTPARGLELVNLYLLRLQTYLFESPVPALLPALAALALAPALSAFDRVLLASSGLLLGMYFAYWHDGFFLGPRFLVPLTPVLALWTARLPGIVRRRFGRGFVDRFVLAGFAVTALMALGLQVPDRATQYRNGLLTMRWDADRAAADAGVRDALVLVRESWGAQLVTRMWGLGLARAEAERIYVHVDACRLDSSLAEVERTGLRDGAALAALTPLLRDSARVERSRMSMDGSEGYLPGAAYGGRCRARLAEDNAGFTLYTPLLLARRGNNVYARDLHARDTVLVRRYPGRPIFVLRRAWAAVDAPIRFFPARLDSLVEDWGLAAAAPPRPRVSAPAERD
jgi:hypothetical protein